MPMKNSRMTDAWVAKVVAANPCQKLPNGNLRTCPVRLAFVNLWTPQEREGKKPSYNAALLFPPGSDSQIQSVFWPEWVSLARATFPQNWGADGRPFGLNWPFHPCDEKQNYSGYTPGCQYVGCSSEFKPQIVDPAMNPITSPERIYSGAWAILALNPYTYRQEKKGVGFGIQSVMIIADDEPLATGGSDPNTDFSGVQIDNAFSPSAAFGTGPVMTPGAPPPPASILPPAQPVGGYGAALPPGDPLAGLV
ncbi:MAG: DUF2815 family protein [Bradyrhizobium sp.]|nr:DUF2815 family protein [Bradyrhizobium sp.]